MSQHLRNIDIIKQGWLKRNSKYIGSWRKRWIVITMENLFTYKTKNIKEKPTEIIQLSKITNVGSFSDTIMYIISNNKPYEFKANTECEKTKWIDDINKYIHHCIKIPVSVECNTNNDYNDHFHLIIPYDNNYLYSINMLTMDIMDYVQQKRFPLKFVATRIKSNSFIEQELIYNEYDWKHSTAIITDYDEIIIKQNGIYLQIDIEIYHHKITSFDMVCKNMNGDTDLCPIYAEMRYQEIYSEEYLNHLYEYKHLEDIKCKYGDTCYAFKRLDEGGNELKDRCHIMIFKHPPRRRNGFRGRNNLQKGLAEGINSICLNDEWAENESLYHPNDEDKKGSNYNKTNGFLRSLMTEMIDNGYKSDLCLNDDDMKKNHYTLLSVVDDKLNCVRHKQMGSPLNRAEMLSLLLYTESDSNYDLCESQRNGDYKRWKWFDYCLFNAINKLSKREYGSYKIYTRLSSTKLTEKYVECGYFKTYVSTSWKREIAETFTADSKGMIFEIDETFREKAICCDVSWISKFAQTECEILIARSIDALLNSFQCKIIDEKNRMQIISLRLYGDAKNKTIENKYDIPINLNLIEKGDKLHESYLSETQLSEKMKFVTRIEKDIVHIFINTIQKILDCIVPLEMFNLICLMYSTNKNSSNKDQIFTQFTHGMTVSNDGKTLTNYKSSSTAYCHIPLYGHFSNIISWSFRVNKLNSARTFSKSKIIIGVQDSSLEFPSGFYGFDNFGSSYRNGVRSRSQKEAFGENDTVMVFYDGKDGMLNLRSLVEKKKYTLFDQIINEINKNGNYQLSISIHGKENKMEYLGKGKSKIMYDVCLLGLEGTGKSQLALQFIQGECKADYDPTIEDLYTKSIAVDGVECIIKLLDTTGQEDMIALRTSWMRCKDIIVLMYSITDRKTFDDLQSFHDQLLEIYQDEAIPVVILIGNHCDLENERVVSKQDGQELCKKWGETTHLHFEVSTKHRINIDQPFFEGIKLFWKINGI